MFPSPDEDRLSAILRRAAEKVSGHGSRESRTVHYTVGRPERDVTYSDYIRAVEHELAKEQESRDPD